MKPILILYLVCLSVFPMSAGRQLEDFPKDTQPAVSAYSRAETDSVRQEMESFFRDINAFNAMYPQEKVYLHFDNTAYFLNETIWFCAYVVRADNLRPEALSRVLYVELLSPEGAVLETKKLPIENGRCHGEFQLDSMYLSGYFEVRAYTRYMLNFGEDAVFSRVFPVYEAVKDGAYHIKTIRDRDLSRRKRAVYVYSSEGKNDFKTRVLEPMRKADTTRYYYEKPKEKDYLINIPVSFYYEREIKNEYEKRISDEQSGYSWDENSVSRNTSPGFDNIEILGDSDMDKAEKEDAKNPLRIQFYPEGGDLIQGIEQRVAFQISDPEGLGIQVTGAVHTPDGNEVAQIIPLHQGKGVFSLTASTKALTARFVVGRKTYEFPLPESRASGCVLSVSTTPQKHVDILLNATKNGNDTVLALAVSQNGNISRFETIQLSQMPYSVRLPRRELSQGVHRISVFDREGRVLAERAICIYDENKEYETILLRGETRDLRPYRIVKLSFFTPDDAHNYDGFSPIPSSDPAKKSLFRSDFNTFSLSVRDRDADDITFNTGNICNYLLLTSELKGYVPDAAYYFEKDDRIHRLHLDLLMLTQGWRRYQWSEMNETFKAESWEQPIEKNLMVDGCVYKYTSLRKPRLKDGLLAFSFAKDSVEYYGDIATNEYGRYAVLLKSFYGTADLVIALHDKTFRGNHWITFNRWYSPKPKNYSFYELNIPTTDRQLEIIEYQRRDSLWHFMLPEASVTKKARRRRVYQQYSLQHYSIEEELAYFQDVFASPLCTESMLAISVLLRYNYPPCMFHIIYAKNYPSDTELVDGIIHWRTDSKQYQLSRMKEMVIRSDSAMVHHYFYPRNRFPGEDDFEPPIGFRVPDYTHTDRPDAIVCFIPNDNYEQKDYGIRKEGYMHTKVYGYSYTKEFYSPDYSKTTLPKLPKDYRRTLYWNPALAFDRDGHVRVNFFNNSTCKDLVISAEGITKKGVPFCFEKE